MALPRSLSDVAFPANQHHSRVYRSSTGNHYVVMRDGGTATKLAVHKADNGDNTWAEVDSSNAATLGATIASIAVHQVSDVLHIAYAASAGGTVEYTTFNMSSDAWSGTETTLVTLHSGATANVAITVRGDGDIVVVYQNAEKVMGTDYQRIFYIHNDGSWNTPVAVDGGGSVSYSIPSIVIGASDKCHITYYDSTNGNVLHKSLSSVYSLSAVETVNDAIVSGSFSNHIAPRKVYYDAAGTERITVLFYQASETNTVSSEIDNDGTPAAIEAIPDSSGGYTIGSYQNASALEYNDEVFYLWIDSLSQDLFISSNPSGAGWSGSATEILDAVTVSKIIAGVLENDSGDTVVAYVYDDAGTIKYNEYVIVEAGGGSITPAAAELSLTSETDFAAIPDPNSEFSLDATVDTTITPEQSAFSLDSTADLVAIPTPPPAELSLSSVVDPTPIPDPDSANFSLASNVDNTLLPDNGAFSLTVTVDLVNIPAPNSQLSLDATLDQTLVPSSANLSLSATVDVSTLFPNESSLSLTSQVDVVSIVVSPAELSLDALLDPSAITPALAEFTLAAIVDLTLLPVESALSLSATVDGVSELITPAAAEFVLRSNVDLMLLVPLTAALSLTGEDAYISIAPVAAEMSLDASVEYSIIVPANAEFSLESTVGNTLRPTSANLSLFSDDAAVVIPSPNAEFSLDSFLDLSVTPDIAAISLTASSLPVEITVTTAELSLNSTVDLQVIAPLAAEFSLSASLSLILMPLSGNFSLDAAVNLSAIEGGVAEFSLAGTVDFVVAEPTAQFSLNADIDLIITPEFSALSLDASVDSIGNSISPDSAVFSITSSDTFIILESESQFSLDATSEFIVSTSPSQFSLDADSDVVGIVVSESQFSLSATTDFVAFSELNANLSITAQSDVVSIVSPTVEFSLSAQSDALILTDLTAVFSLDSVVDGLNNTIIPDEAEFVIDATNQFILLVSDAEFGLSADDTFIVSFDVAELSLAAQTDVVAIVTGEAVFSLGAVAFAIFEGTFFYALIRATELRPIQSTSRLKFETESSSHDYGSITGTSRNKRVVSTSSEQTVQISKVED